MFHADDKLKQLTEGNEKLTAMIEKLDQHENAREQ